MITGIMKDISNNYLNHERRIEFQTSVLAKKLEFMFGSSDPTYVNGFYCETDDNGHLDLSTFKECEIQVEDCSREDYYLRPTQTSLQTWLRDFHNIEVYVLPIFREKCGYDSFRRDGFSFQIIRTNPCQLLDWSSFNQCGEDRDENQECFNPSFKSYEDALEDGLKQALLMALGVNHQ